MFPTEASFKARYVIARLCEASKIINSYEVPLWQVNEISFPSVACSTRRKNISLRALFPSFRIISNGNAKRSRVTKRNSYCSYQPDKRTEGRFMRLALVATGQGLLEGLVSGMAQSGRILRRFMLIYGRRARRCRTNWKSTTEIDSSNGRASAFCEAKLWKSEVHWMKTEGKRVELKCQLFRISN